MQTMATITVTRRVTMTVACPGDREAAEARIRAFFTSPAFDGRLDGRMSGGGDNFETIGLDFAEVGEAEAHAADFQLEEAAL